MATLTIIAVLATFPASLLATLRISVTETYYVNFTCKSPPYLNLKKLYSLQLWLTTESHFRRSLLNVSREEHFNNSVGDIPTLFRHEGKVIESDAGSSSLNASFPLTEDLYGKYSCVTLYEPLEETGRKEQAAHLEINGPWVNQKDSEGFRAILRPAHRVRAQWLLQELPGNSPVIIITRQMPTNTSDKQELVTCKQEKDQPHCFPFPVLSDFNLSYSSYSGVVTLYFVTIEDAGSPCMNYVISISQSTLRSFSRELCTLPTNSSEHFSCSVLQDCNCTIQIIISVVVAVVVVAAVTILIALRKKIPNCFRQHRRTRRSYINNNRSADEIRQINVKLGSNDEDDEEHNVSDVQTSPVGELSHSSPAGGQQDHSLFAGGQRNSSSPGRHQRGSGVQQNSSLQDGQQSSSPPAGSQNEFDAQLDHSTPSGGQNNFGAQQIFSPSSHDQQNLVGVSEQAPSSDISVHRARDQ